MAIVIDSVFPNPIVIPRNGSIDVLVTAHSTEPDLSGNLEISLRQEDGTLVVLTTIQGVKVDSSEDPIPWDQIQLVPFGLPNVTVTHVNQGAYRLTHSAV